MGFGPDVRQYAELPGSARRPPATRARKQNYLSTKRFLPSPIGAADRKAAVNGGLILRMVCSAAP
jgi:hypothetical protein